jgi:hypothetical protein
MAIAEDGERTMMGAAPEMIGVGEKDTITITITMTTRPVTVAGR